ncbi:Progestin and adipoQ receptor family member 4, partial [Trachymyrmex cornetzi]
LAHGSRRRSRYTASSAGRTDPSSPRQRAPRVRLCTTLFRDDERPRHAAAVSGSSHQDTDTYGARRQDDKRMPDGAETSAKVLLLRWSEMPRHLQFNPHILTGYRPLMTIRQCLGSLFYIHNETVNILTHELHPKIHLPESILYERSCVLIGFAILYMLVTVPHLLPWNTKGTLVGVLSWCHFIGAVSPWIGSFLYHLFMNVNYDEVLYRTLLKVDMIGIWLRFSISRTNISGAIPMMAAAVHCLADNVWYCCIFIYCSLSVWGLLKAMTAKSPWERRLCFAPPFLMRMLIMMLRCFGIGGGSPEALIHIILQDLIAVIGATIGALRIPEKWIPGRLDLVLNSHNVMHVMVVLAVCSMHAATLKDLAWMSDPSTCNKTSSLPSDREEL